jgi:predicted lipoprotein with Yx(FWY)xxD motif
MGFTMFRILIIVAAILASAANASVNAHESSAPAPPPKDDGSTMPRISATKNGLVLIDPKGMTLYYFDRDDSGTKSTCDGKCAERWIPVAAPSNAEAKGDFTVITRSDGSKMWAYRHRPLYTSRADHAPGAADGYDPEQLWHIARPE